MEQEQQKNQQGNNHGCKYCMKKLEQLCFQKKKIVIIGMIIFFIGILIYFNNCYLWSINLFSESGVKVVNLGAEFKVGLHDVVVTKNNDVKLKIIKFREDLSMGYGGGPYVQYEYSIKEKKGFYGGEESHTLPVFLENGYRITLLKSDFENYAIMKIEEEYGEISNCNWIDNKENREDCFFEVAKNIKDEAPCVEMQNDWRRDACYKFVAPYKKDFSICEKIIDIPQKYRCYSGVAVETKDFSLCGKTEDGHHFKISECYSEVARVLGDSFTRESVENWLVYNNEKFKYEIKYPKDMLVVGNNSRIRIQTKFNNEESHYKFNQIKELFIEVVDNKNIQEVINQINNKKEVKTIYINDKEVTQVTSMAYNLPEKHINDSKINLLIENNNNVYQARYINSEKYGLTFRQILSTFELLN